MHKVLLLQVFDRLEMDGKEAHKLFGGFNPEEKLVYLENHESNRALRFVTN